MTEQRATLDSETTARLADFARACKAAARAVSLYPAAHPAIGATLGRLTELTAALTTNGPFTLQVRPQILLVGEAAPARPDSAIVEIADMFRRHLIGALTLNAGLDATSWRTLLLLLARTPEDVRADGGIARLWATAGGPSVEIEEIDYAEVLREKEGDVATIERVIAAALAGPQLELDDSAMHTLLEIVGDPERLKELMKGSRRATAEKRRSTRGRRRSSASSRPDGIRRPDEPGAARQVFRQVGHAAGAMSAEGMLELLARRTQTRSHGRLGQRRQRDGPAHGRRDGREFVSNSVIAERGASERLAQAFQTLVPERDRQRQLLALARKTSPASELGQEEISPSSGSSVEAMMTSYTDASFVSDEYARELTAHAPGPSTWRRPATIRRSGSAAWLATVSDAALRTLDLQLLIDLLVIEADGARWRDIAETVVTHAEDLVRVGYFDQAWVLADRSAIEGQKDPGRGTAARAALDRFGRGRDDKHVAKHLRGADDDSYERFKRLVPQHRTGGDSAARRGALGRTGRAIEAADARHSRRVRRGGP